MQAREQPLVVGDPVERGRGEDRVDGLAQVELEEVGAADVHVRRQQRARLLHHRGRAVDRDHAAGGEPLVQQAGDAAGAAARVEHGLVAAEDEAVEHVGAHRGHRRRQALVGGGVPVTRGIRLYVITYRVVLHLGRSEDDALGVVAGALDELAHLGGALPPLAQHVGGDDLRVRRVGPADADPHAVEVRAAQLALERLEPVVSGEPAAEPHADVAERKVDLVVQHEHAVEAELEGAAGRADGAARLVHVGLRLEHGHARAARAGAALGQLAGELLARLRQVPARDQRVGDLEADVVRRAVVAAAGVPQPDDEPVGGR